MEPEVSLPNSQTPATFPYLEPARSSPYPPHLTSWRYIFILSSHLRLVLPNGLSFPQVSPTKLCIASPLPHTRYMPRPSRYSRFLLVVYTNIGDRGSTAVKVLCYKSEGRWFDSRWYHWNSSLTLSFRSHYGPGVDSASNRNEYQEYFLGVKLAGA